jgi:hypothetical protein
LRVTKDTSETRVMTPASFELGEVVFGARVNTTVVDPPGAMEVIVDGDVSEM